VSGLTHGFYRYPARFSPLFVRAAIEAFTERGDVVMDPFMGGATTPVEALALGRRVVGVDINALAVFVARAKTLLLPEDDLAAVRRWGVRAVETVNLHDPATRPADWIALGYQRNLGDRQTWRIRKWLELMLHRVPRLSTPERQMFARAVVLHTAQWTLDCRSEVPPIQSVRQQFIIALAEMVEGARTFRTAVAANGCPAPPVFLNRSAAGIEFEGVLQKLDTPRLIITSPPYFVAATIASIGEKPNRLTKCSKSRASSPSIAIPCGSR